MNVSKDEFVREIMQRQRLQALRRFAAFRHARPAVFCRPRRFPTCGAFRVPAAPRPPRLSVSCGVRVPAVFAICRDASSAVEERERDGARAGVRADRAADGVAG